MATLVSQFTDDFSGYAADVHLVTLPDYDVYSFTAPGSLKTTGAGDIKLTPGTYLVYGHDVGSVNHYSKVTLASTPTQSAYNRIGAAVRVVDFANFIGIATGGNLLRLFVANNSGNTYLQNISGTIPVAGDVIELQVLDNIVTVLVNGAAVGNPEDISNLTQLSTATKAGGSAGNQVMNPAASFIDVGTIESNALFSIDEFDTSTVNIDFSATGDFETATGDFNISGGYTVEPAPSSILYRLVDHENTGVVVKDWAVLDGSPSANSFSGVITSTKTKLCFVEVKGSDDVANENVVRSSGRVGFGLTLWVDGQSNINSLKQAYSALTADTSARLFNTAVGVNEWQSIDNNTMGLFVNTLVAHLNCAITIGMTGVDGSSISQHNGDPIAVGDQLAIDAMGGNVGMYIWGQGESDYGTSNAYHAALTTRRNQLLTRQGKTAAQLPMAIVQLGRHSGGTGSDIGWSAIRKIQTEFAEASTNVFISHQGIDLELFDQFHRTAEGAATEVLRLADSILNYYGYLSTTGNGSFPIGAIFSGNIVTISHDLNGGSSLTVPANSHLLYEVSNDNFASNIVKPTSANTTANPNEIELTFASLPSGSLRVRSHQYQDFILADLPISDKVYEGNSTMVAPITTYLAVSAGLASVFNLINTGTPDGTYETKFYNDDTDTHIETVNLTFSGGDASKTLNVATGTNVFSKTDGANPPTTGLSYIGVTE